MHRNAFAAILLATFAMPADSVRAGPILPNLASAHNINSSS